LVDNLTACFLSRDIIQAARIFDPGVVPGSDTDYVADGENDLLLLTGHYSSFMDHNLCSLEWDTLKHCMKISYAKYSLRDFMLKLATDETPIAHYPSLSNLTEIVKYVEKGLFFLTKLYKDKILRVCHLDQLLRLRLNACKGYKISYS